MPELQGMNFFLDIIDNKFSVCWCHSNRKFNYLPRLLYIFDNEPVGKQFLSKQTSVMF